mgnify:CR=1 FL=1
MVETPWMALVTRKCDGAVIRLGQWPSHATAIRAARESIGWRTADADWDAWASVNITWDERVEYFSALPVGHLFRFWQGDDNDIRQKRSGTFYVYPESPDAKPGGFRTSPRALVVRAYSDATYPQG